MAAYAAFATQVSAALRTLLESTGVELQPAVDLVSCGAGPNEHFVPRTALEKHLRRCHGERRPRPVVNAEFYYGRRKRGSVEHHRAENNSAGSGNREDAAGDIGGGDGAEELQSLLEPESLRSDVMTDQDQGVIDSITKMATSAGDFYEQVQAWQRIPRAFATMKENERVLVTPSSLRRWLNAELSRPGMLPAGDPLDEELVEYVAGLLDHPDFCQPDLLVLELHEFLGSSVTVFVLALYKFMVVEIGLHSVFKMVRHGVDNNIQTASTKTPRAVTSEAPEANSDVADKLADRDYKRRRASYRGKVGTKTGPAAFREMIQKHMIGHSVELDRELVLGGGFLEERKVDTKKEQPRLELMNWRNFTDALEVRNRNRPGRQERRTERPRSRSRSRSRRHCGTRNTPSVTDREYRRRKRRSQSPDRGERISSRHRQEKSRSRSRDHRDTKHRKRRRRSSSQDRDKNNTRRECHRPDYRH